MLWQSRAPGTADTAARIGCSLPAGDESTSAASMVRRPSGQHTQITSTETPSAATASASSAWLLYFFAVRANLHGTVLSTGIQRALPSAEPGGLFRETSEKAGETELLRIAGPCDGASLRRRVAGAPCSSSIETAAPATRQPRRGRTPCRW